ncbi:hypothetical protein HYPSUDRAFT_202493 [Hypholoma sublateritium FD-334 SS-4]|uniref:Uncharacterized protein n=1 Tax=Hypholoma sublateritium (strain FD-334 SS-4) TaxID=945553 RepID=A0A0D2NSY7_HYPSF|nr:hypothetical protein HYPSUDRAFT_202493 [Hypholoma sublateritium FD-334 SS-4]
MSSSSPRENSPPSLERSTTLTTSPGVRRRKYYHLGEQTRDPQFPSASLGDGTTVAATAGNINGALIAGGSNKGVIFLWKRLAADNVAERSAVDPDKTPPQQTTITMNTDPINPQVVLLIFILTWTSWYPYLIASAYELVVQQLPTA